MTQYVKGLRCLKCGSEYEIKSMSEGCPSCRTGSFCSNLEVVYDYKKMIADGLPDLIKKRKKQGMQKYKELLPLKKNEILYSLGEGNSSLVKLDRTGTLIGSEALYVKNESQNPTWSHKDRYCSVAISKGAAFGASIVVAASSGNHGLSTAAYAAKAGIDCVILTVKSIPKNVVQLIKAFGAKVVVTTNEGRWSLMRYAVNEHNWYPITNYSSPMAAGNPFGVEGYKTIAYEICEDLEWQAPSWVVVPVGRGETLYGIWKGFVEAKYLGLISKLPKMVAVEPEVMGPLTRAYASGLNEVPQVPRKSTAASGIGGNVGSYQGLVALQQSGGKGILVSEKEMLEGLTLLAAEGLYSELSSAAAIAGVKKLYSLEERVEGSVVCLLTSSGLKEPLQKSDELEMLKIDPDNHKFESMIKKMFY